MSEVLYGSTVPRIWTKPLVTGTAGPCGCGCALTVRSSLGFSAVEFAEQTIGMRLHPWQRWLLIHAMELERGRFRFRTVLILVARQNGKTSIVEVKNLWKMFVLGVPLVLATAQNLDVAEESWDKAIEIIEGTTELLAELESVNKVNGKKSFKLVSGSRWKVQAANRRGGRGLSAQDINMDELREHQKWDAWGAITKTSMAQEEAQIWCFSNAGDDASIVLNDLQAQGRAVAAAPGRPADPSFGHFEWSAPDDTRCTCARPKGEPHESWCQLMDRAVQALANPSAGFPGGVPWSVLESAAHQDTNEVFLTENLCVRVADLSGRSIDIARWNDLGDRHSERDGSVALAIDVSPDREWSAIALAGVRADGAGHLQLLDYLEGTGQLLDRLDVWRDALKPLAIGMGAGTYASFREELRERGYESAADRPWDTRNEPLFGDLIIIKGADTAAACGQLIDAVRQGTDRHVPAKQVAAAIPMATTRRAGGDAVAWKPRDESAPILGLNVITYARYAYHARVALVGDDDYDPLDNFF